MESARKARILAIATDIVTGSLYDAILKSGDYVPHLCTCMEEAFELVSNSLPHLIIIHVGSQSETSVLEFLAKMRHICRGKQPPILMIVPKHWPHQSMEALIDAYMTFPIIPDQFLETVESLLQRRLGR